MSADGEDTKTDNPMQEETPAGQEAGDAESTETGVFLGGEMDLPMTMHQAAVKVCMSEDVDDGMKLGFVARFLFITLLEFCIMSAMSWDRGCTTHDQCKQGVSACWDLGGNGNKQCHYCHDFYIDRTCKAAEMDDDDNPGDCDDADTETFWNRIQWRATRQGHSPPWAGEPDPITIDHAYAGVTLPVHVGNSSFECYPDDTMCHQCFNLATKKFGRLGDTDVASDILRSMKRNDWLVLLAFGIFQSSMAAALIADIATQVMIMNRAMKAQVPGIMPYVILFNVFAGARHFALGVMFGIFNIFARVHHDSGHAKDQLTFLMQGFFVLNFSRFIYYFAAPPHIRKKIADKESEYEATPAELNTLFYTRVLYILLITESTWVTLWAIRDGGNPVPPMHLMFNWLVIIAYGALYPAENTGERLKNVGLQFGRFICGFITFILVDTLIFND